MRARKLTALAALAALAAVASAARADDPDLIFKKTTVWKFLSPDHKLATYAIDDPDVEGVACHFTLPEKGGWTGWLGLAEELSDASLACRQVGDQVPAQGRAGSGGVQPAPLAVLQARADRARVRR
jgi:CreA protein